jgi:predicted transposase/invertase (TIGR01784 family)
VAQYSNLSEKERTMIDYEVLSRADAQAALAYATDQRIAQGREQGIVQGIARGREQTAQRMLAKGMALDDIRELTGLDGEAIRRLQEN